MQLKIFSIRDTKGELYTTPFFQKSHGEAERSFNQLVNNPESTVSKYPEDFDLFFIGDFDDQSGKLTTLATPQHLIKAVNSKRQNFPPLN